MASTRVIPSHAMPRPPVGGARDYKSRPACCDARFGPGRQPTLSRRGAGSGWRCRFPLIVWSGVAMGLIGDGPALCAPPEPPSPQQEQILQEQDENNGQDFTRPQGLFQVRYEYRSATRTGAVEGSTHELISNIVTLRADERIDLIPDWTLALRTDLPMVVKNPITDDNPSGNDEYSIGDVDFQSGITTSFNTRWAAGGGVRIVAPTAGDGLGTGKWRLLWGAGVRYMLPEIGPDSYFVPQVRYDVSFAGDPS